MTGLRRLFSLGAIALASAGFLAAACGIDVLGTGPLTEAGAGSADAAGDASVPPSCSTLDISCLGALPPGWQPVSLGSPACGADFTPAALVTNPQANIGACACGACRPLDFFTCTGMTTIRAGDSCDDDPPLAKAPPGTCTNASAQYLKATPPMAGGTISCAAANDAGTGATAEALTVCVPGCAADYCGSASRCVIADGDLACPSGFQLHAHAGASADPGCPPCECEAGARGACRGTVTAFEGKACADSGTITTYPVGTDACNEFSSSINYESVLVKLVPPDASCSPVLGPTPPVGDASLVGMKTICCQ